MRFWLQLTVLLLAFAAVTFLAVRPPQHAYISIRRRVDRRTGRLELPSSYDRWRHVNTPRLMIYLVMIPSVAGITLWVIHAKWPKK